MWNELQDAGELRTAELSVAFTFKPGKLGEKLLFQQVTMATEKQTSKKLRFLTPRENLCKNKRHIPNLNRFK